MNNGSSLGEDACWLNRRVQSRSSLIPPQPGARLESRAVTLSALGQKRTCAAQTGISALPQKADMCSARAHVRFVPKADIRVVVENRKTASRRSLQKFSGS